MPRLRKLDLRRIDALRDRLGSWSEGEGPVLESIMPALRELMEADKSYAYGLTPSERGISLEYGYGAGFELRAANGIFDAWLSGRTLGWAHYNPFRPERNQRNVPVTLDQLGTPTEIVRDLYPRVGLAGHDQVRVLICDGAALLGWVGVFRADDRFGQRDRQRLAAIVPHLQARLSLERRLATSDLRLALIDALLDDLGGAAFVLDGRGRVVHANGPGLGRLEREGGTLTARLVTAVREGGGGGLGHTRLASHGAPDHHLVVERPNPGDPVARARSAAHRWGLTPRQTEVLELLSCGHSNRTIAEQLGCAEKTVEVHVAAVFTRTQTASRAALVSRLWAESEVLGGPGLNAPAPEIARATRLADERAG